MPRPLPSLSIIVIVIQMRCRKNQMGKSMQCPLGSTNPKNELGWAAVEQRGSREHPGGPAQAVGDRLSVFLGANLVCRCAVWRPD